MFRVKRLLSTALILLGSFSGAAFSAEDNEGVLEQLSNNAVVNTLTDNQAVNGVRNALGIAAEKTKKLIGIADMPKRDCRPARYRPGGGKRASGHQPRPAQHPWHQ